LTKAGTKVIKRFTLITAADMERLTSESLTREERRTLISLLKKIGYERQPSQKSSRDVPASAPNWNERNVMSMVSEVLRKMEETRADGMRTVAGSGNRVETLEGQRFLVRRPFPTRRSERDPLRDPEKGSRVPESGCTDSNCG